MSLHRTSYATPFVTSIVATCLATLLSTAIANAEQKDDAASLFANGLRLYAEKNYEEAAVELAASYEAKADQRTLFAWAQAVRLSGQCEKSRELLANYVANGANSKQSKAAFKLMEDCTDSEVPDAPTNPEPPAVVEEPPVASEEGGESTNAIAVTSSARPSTVDSVSPWYKDWVAVGLLSVGVVGLGVSGLTYSSALQLESDGMQAGTSYDEFLDLKERSQDRRNLSLLTGTAGALLIGGGITYLLLRDTTTSSERSTVSLQLDGDRAGFAISGNF